MFDLWGDPVTDPVDPTDEPARPRWWVTTDLLAHGGKKIIGPFASSDLARRVRSYIEKAENRVDLWVDSDG